MARASELTTEVAARCTGEDRNGRRIRKTGAARGHGSRTARGVRPVCFLLDGFTGRRLKPLLDVWFGSKRNDANTEHGDAELQQAKIRGQRHTDPVADDVDTSG